MEIDLLKAELQNYRELLIDAYALIDEMSGYKHPYTERWVKKEAFIFLETLKDELGEEIDNEIRVSV